MKTLMTYYSGDSKTDLEWTKQYAEEVLKYCNRIEDLSIIAPDVSHEVVCLRYEQIYQEFKQSLIYKQLMKEIEKDDN